MSTAAPPAPAETPVTEEEYAAELEEVKELARRMGFEEVEDDGWGFRAQDFGGGPVGEPGPLGPAVTVEKASAGPLPA